MGQISMEKSGPPGSDLSGNQQPQGHSFVPHAGQLPCRAFAAACPPCLLRARSPPYVWHREPAAGRMPEGVSLEKQADVRRMRRPPKAWYIVQTACCHTLSDNIDRNDYTCEQIIEVMSDTTSELSNSLHLMRLAQSSLHAISLLFLVCVARFHGRYHLLGEVSSAFSPDACPGIRCADFPLPRWRSSRWGASAASLTCGFPLYESGVRCRFLVRHNHYGIIV
jgi:hypothetical protein